MSVQQYGKHWGPSLFHLDLPRKIVPQYNIPGTWHHILEPFFTVLRFVQPWNPAPSLVCNKWLIFLFFFTCCCNVNVISSRQPSSTLLTNQTPPHQHRQMASLHHTAGQGGGSSSGRGRHSLDRSAGREGGQGLQELGSGGRGSATDNDNGFGDADHRAPGCINRCPPAKGGQGTGVGRLASGVHPAAAAKPSRTFAGAAATVSDGSRGKDGCSWTADPGTGVAGDLAYCCSTDPSALAVFVLRCCWLILLFVCM